MTDLKPKKINENEYQIDANICDRKLLIVDGKIKN